MWGSCGFRNGSLSLRNLPLRSAVIPSESCTPSNSHSQQQKCKERICFHSYLEQDSKKPGHPRVHYIHRTVGHGRPEEESLSWSKLAPGTSSFYQWVCLTEFHFTNLLQEAAWVFHICLGLPVETGSLHIQIQSLFFPFSLERGMLVHSSGALIGGCQHGSFCIPSQVHPIRANTELKSLAMGWSSWRKTDVEVSAPQWRALFHKHKDLSSVPWTQAWGCALVSSVLGNRYMRFRASQPRWVSCQ